MCRVCQVWYQIKILSSSGHLQQTQSACSCQSYTVYTYIDNIPKVTACHCIPPYCCLRLPCKLTTTLSPCLCANVGQNKKPASTTNLLDSSLEETSPLQPLVPYDVPVPSNTQISQKCNSNLQNLYHCLGDGPKTDSIYCRMVVYI